MTGRWERGGLKRRLFSHCKPKVAERIRTVLGGGRKKVL